MWPTPTHVTRPIWTHCRSRLYSCAQSTSQWCFTILERWLLRCGEGRWQRRGGQWHKGSQQGPRAGVARFPTHCCATITPPSAALHLVCFFCLRCKLLLVLLLQTQCLKVQICTSFVFLDAMCNGKLWSVIVLFVFVLCFLCKTTCLIAKPDSAFKLKGFYVIGHIKGVK